MTSFISAIRHEIWQKQHAKVCKGHIHFPLVDFVSHPNFQPLPCEAAASALSEAAAPALRSITVATRSASRCFSICRVVLKGKAPLRQKRLWHSFCMCSSTDFGIRIATEINDPSPYLTQRCADLWMTWSFAEGDSALELRIASLSDNPDFQIPLWLHWRSCIWLSWSERNEQLGNVHCPPQRKGQKNRKRGKKTPKEKMREDGTM